MNRTRALEAQRRAIEFMMSQMEARQYGRYPGDREQSSNVDHGHRVDGHCIPMAPFEL